METYNWYIAAIGNSLVQWAVPVFVMISGALFLNPKRTITKEEVLNKYVKRLIIAYISWCVFYGLISITLASFETHTIVFRISSLLPCYHLWYLPMLMGVYLLIPVLRKISNDLSLTKYVLIIWTGYITIGFLTTAFNTDIPQISVLFTLNRVVGFIGYFLLGYYITTISIGMRMKFCIYSAGIIGGIIMIAGNIVTSVMMGEGDERFINDLSLHVAMMALAVFVFIKENVHFFENSLKRFVEYMRKDLFGVYLVHVLWLMIFNRPLFRDIGNHIFTLPLIAIVVFAASLFTCKIIRRIPYLKRVVE